MKQGRFFSPGAARLRAELDRRGLSHTAAEDLLGAGRGAMCRWVGGDVRPGVRFLFAIRDEFGIELELWRPKGDAAKNRLRRRAAA